MLGYLQDRVWWAPSFFQLSLCLARVRRHPCHPCVFVYIFLFLLFCLFPPVFLFLFLFEVCVFFFFLLLTGAILSSLSALPELVGIIFTHFTCAGLQYLPEKHFLTHLVPQFLHLVTHFLRLQPKGPSLDHLAMEV